MEFNCHFRIPGIVTRDGPMFSVCVFGKDDALISFGHYRSLHIVLEDLGLTKAFIVYPGKDRYPDREKVEVIPIRTCVDLKFNG